MIQNLYELLFWFLFIVLNSSFYLINYVFYFKTTRFLPYITELLTSKRISIISSRNMDFFRYSIEFSTILILSCFIDLTMFHVLITMLYLLTLVYNIYQYAIRRIYETEPLLVNDLSLLKTGLSIAWSESPRKIILLGLLLIFLFIGIDRGFHIFLEYNHNLHPSAAFTALSLLFALNVLGVTYKMRGFYRSYPNDIFLRLHYTLAEFLLNLKLSYKFYQVSKEKHGETYHSKRSGIRFELNGSPPNIYFLLIEAYGSFYFDEPELSDSSQCTFKGFTRQLENRGYSILSQYSESTTTGGQSWLPYSSFLFGYRMDNDFLFKNYLRDPMFRQANSLLHLLKQAGYTNYNLNPITPIEGINVPYKEMREFYSIDDWLLRDKIEYHGDVYGFGSCPPDQYSLNYAINHIRNQGQSPYTLFFLTKNSHTPFVSPKYEEQWQSLQFRSTPQHINKGFFSYPTIRDYRQAIEYEFNLLGDFISENGGENDIFIVLGDHQPPILCDPSNPDLRTPVHVISKHRPFVESFRTYGFEEWPVKNEKPIRHESLYSIFLNLFSKHYAKEVRNIPDYEPNGLQF